MSKKHSNPHQGGSYTHDPATGKTALVETTQPALTAQEIIDGWAYDEHNVKRAPKPPAIEVAQVAAPVAAPAATKKS